MSLVLDREVGDAAARVELIGRGESIGRAGIGQRRQLPQWSASRGSGSSSADVRIAPRNSQEPYSRETRLVCLPCQPRPAASPRGFSINGAVSTNSLTAAPLASASAPATRFSPAFTTSW
jgi:hypothetical protein